MLIFTHLVKKLHDIWYLKIHITVFTEVSMLSGSVVTMAWCILRLQMEEKASRYEG
jgi:hypothetical protein